MNEPMSAEEMHTRLELVITSMSRQCDRRILAMRDDGQDGIALSGPRSIIQATILGAGFIYDQYLN
jgi:hypothetical protein